MINYDEVDMEENRYVMLDIRLAFYIDFEVLMYLDEMIWRSVLPNNLCVITIKYYDWDDRETLTKLKVVGMRHNVMYQ